MWSQQGEEKGKSTKEKKRSQTHEQNKVAPAVDTWYVLHQVNAVQSPPVKSLNL